MHPRESNIRHAVKNGQLPSLEDIRWVLATLDAVRYRQSGDSLTTAVIDVHGDSFADVLIHKMWEVVKESCEHEMES